MNVISQEAIAKIAMNKSLLKEYKSSNFERVVYLNDGDEFQIQLYNPTTKPIAAKISIDGESLGDMLVLRPAERIWLERYLNTSRKFKFSTYEVANSKEAKRITKGNGTIKIEFFEKEERNKPIYVLNAQPYIKSIDYNDYNCNGIYYCNSACTNDEGLSTLSCSNISVSCNDAPVRSTSAAATMDWCASSISTSSVTPTSYSTSKTMETGRVEKGGYSDQKFTYIDMDFKSWPFKTEEIHILPLSRKPVTSNDLKKRYCTNCGRKISPKHKYCPYCGTKVD